MLFSSDFRIFFEIIISLVLLYNVLTTLLPNYKKELLTGNRKVRRLQLCILIVLLICIIVYYIMEEDVSNQLSVFPWIWGFLFGHVVSTFKKRWSHQLFGMGILLTIMFVLLYKDDDIIQLCKALEITAIKTNVYIVYMSFGCILGLLLWPETEYE